MISFETIERIPRPVRTVGRVVRRSWRQATQRSRMLPDFIVIGAQKAGTTSLYDHVVAHPAVHPAIGKGIHYFDEEYNRGAAWYRSNFPIDRPGRTTGEASPDYLPHPNVPARVAALVPSVRLVAVLRNPAERALSHYFHNRNRGRETLSFRAAIDAEDGRLAGELERMQREPAYESEPLRHQAYRTRGLYADQLERWLEHFDRSQLLVLLSEDLDGDPDGTMAQVFTHLGLAPHRIERYRRLNTGRYDDLDDETLAALDDLRLFFGDSNRRLSELLGRPTW